MENKELTHHGIKGMRWGVRRYQNPDGTLTVKGKKRYSAEMEKLKKEEQVLKNKQRTQAKVDKLLKKRQELDEMKRKMSGEDDTAKLKTAKSQTPNKPKSISEMSDEELMAKINRMRLEQTYKALTPQTKSKGEEFVDKILKPAGQKLANKLGDTILDKVNAEIRKKFGIDAGEDEMKALKKEAEKWKHKKTIADGTKSWKEAFGNDSNDANKKTGNSDDNTKNSKKPDSNGGSKNSKKGDEKESFTGEVFGEGTSKRSNSGSNKTKRDDYYDPIYSTFKDISDDSPYSSSVSTYRSSGKSAVTDLLSGPAGSYLLPALRDDK